jgi:hypothetical protein
MATASPWQILGIPMIRAEIIAAWAGRSTCASHSGIFAKSIASLIVTIALISGVSQHGFAAVEQLAFDAHEMEYHPGIDDTEVVATSPFANAGTTPVTISDLTTSCACTTAVEDKRIYAAGQKGIITAKFSIGDRLGLQIKKIRVRTQDDKDKGESLLTMKIFIPPGPSITPKITSWEVGSEATEKTVIISIPQDSDYTVTSVQSSDQHFRAQLFAGQGKNGFIVKLYPYTMDKPYTASIDLKTNHRTFHLYARIEEKADGR